MAEIRIAILLFATSVAALASAAERPPGRSIDFYYDQPGEDGGYSIRQTADGGYLVAGTTAGSGGDRDMAVWKFTHDLLLDSNFAEQGVLRIGSSGDDQAADAIQVLTERGNPDGYLMVGYADTADLDFAAETHHGKIDTVIVRLDSNGRPDPHWYDNGILFWGGEEDDEPIVHHHNYTEPGDRLLQVPGGFILATHTRSTEGDLQTVKTVGTSEGRDAILLKLNMQGDLDTGWADQGVFRFGTVPGNQDRQEHANDFLFSIRELSDGDIAASGYTLGKEFRNDNIVVKTRGNNDDQGIAVADGNPDLYKMDMMVLKLTPHGQLRDSWGQHGMVFIGGTRQEKGYDLFEDREGRLLLTGRTSSFDLDIERQEDGLNGRDMLLYRINQDGSADERFNENGAVTLPGGVGQFQRAVTLRDFNILALGFTDNNSGVFALPGSPDLHRQGVLAIFSDLGELIKLYSLGLEGEDKPSSLLVDRDGNVLVTGFRIPDAMADYDKNDPELARRQLWVSRYEMGLRTGIQ